MAVFPGANFFVLAVKCDGGPTMLVSGNSLIRPTGVLARCLKGEICAPRNEHFSLLFPYYLVQKSRSHVSYRFLIYT